jgi:hypothetical protein
MANITGIGTGFGLKSFAKEGRLKTIVGTNALVNPTFFQSASAESVYPVGAMFNGHKSDTLDGSGQERQFFYPLAWSPYSPLFTNTTSYSSLVNNNFLTNYRPYEDTALFGGILQSSIGGQYISDVNYRRDRVLKLFGAGSSLISFNRDPDRTYPDPPITGNVEAGYTVGTGTTWGDSRLWTRYEWSQGVTIPAGATQVTFGAYFRCPPEDLFRDLNFGGCYIFQDVNENPPTNVKINAIVLKRSAHSLNLPTGSSQQGHYNWSGLSDIFTFGENRYPLRWNDSINTQSITYENAEDFAHFKAVTKTITLSPESNTFNRLGFAMFFSENQSYMTEPPPSPNPPSGAIQFYNPFVIFSS